jgi:hypothetical protein
MTPPARRSVQEHDTRQLHAMALGLMGQTIERAEVLRKMRLVGLPRSDGQG